MRVSCPGGQHGKRCLSFWRKPFRTPRRVVDPAQAGSLKEWLETTGYEPKTMSSGENMPPGLGGTPAPNAGADSGEPQPEAPAMNEAVQAVIDELLNELAVTRESLTELGTALNQSRRDCAEQAAQVTELLEVKKVLEESD